MFARQDTNLSADFCTFVDGVRTAVDARFAMGYSNDAYLNQACLPVWAGPGADAIAVL